MAQHPEPPELKDSSGENIVVFRRPDGSFFSNHPEYEFALAMHRQAQSNAAQMEQPAVDTTDLEDDVPQEEDNNDGTVTYEEMDSKQLLKLTQERGLTLPDRKRASAIAALEQYDLEHEGSEE